MGLSQNRTADATIVRGGIDRIDSSKGYESSNVVPACEQCNKAKLDYTPQEFDTWFERLAAFRGYKKVK